MNEPIITSIISACAIILSQVIITYQTHRKDQTNLALFEQEVHSRLNSIEEKLDTHNHYADQIHEIQLSLVKMEQSIKNLEENYGKKEKSGKSKA